jgi:photosystem II stability/assembly factor-like uncharacterized protein
MINSSNIFIPEATPHRRRVLPRKLTRLLQSLTLLAAVSWASPFCHAEAMDPTSLNRPAAQVSWAQRAWLLSIALAGSNLVAVGERGIVLISQDKGSTWIQAKEVPTSVTLTRVRFISDREGWATGHMGIVLHSMDGGRHWTKLTDGKQYAKVASAQLEQAASRANEPQQRQSYLGIADGLLRDGADKPFLALVAMQPQVLALGAFGIALQSAPHSKEIRSMVENLANPNGLHVYGATHHGDTIYAVGEQGLIIKSFPDGRLRQIESPYKGTLFGITATRDGFLLAYGLRGTVLRSTDGGQSWNIVPSGTSLAITSGVELPDGRIVLGSQSGQILVSQDRGQSFTVLTVVSQPVADLAPSGDGELIVVGPRGITKTELRTKAVNK